jgi:hypothetical protein
MMKKMRVFSIDSRWSMYVVFAFFAMINLPKAYSQNFYALTNVREVRVTFSDPNWSKKLKALKDREPNRRLIATVTVDGTRFDSVGVRYKGNSSYNNPSKKEQRKLPLNIKLDHIRFGQLLPDGISTLKLSNAFRDPSFVREPLAYEIAQLYMPAPRSNFAKVYINDEFMGVYNSTESIDKPFLIKKFGNTGKALFKCDPDDWQAFTQKAGCKLSKEASLTNLGAATDCYKELYEISGDASHYAALTKLIMKLEKEPEKIGELLDLDQTLWMLAFNNLFVNLDSYNGHLSHNYYLFLDSSDHFRPILWDMNLCFGGFRYNGKSVLTNQQLIEYAPLADLQNPNRPLISKLLSNEFNKKLYFHHMRIMMEDWVESKRYFTSATQMQGTIDAAVLEDKQKLYTYEAFKENLKTTTDAAKAESIGINELMEGRLFFLKGQQELKLSGPKIGNQSHKVMADTVHFKIAVDKEVQPNVVLMYRANAKSLFRSVQCTATEASSGAEYSIKLPKKEVKEYYYIVEDDQTISTFPARASFDFLRVKE